jgi:hypothetical protein
MNSDVFFEMRLMTIILKLRTLHLTSTRFAHRSYNSGVRSTPADVARHPFAYFIVSKFDWTLLADISRHVTRGALLNFS